MTEDKEPIFNLDAEEQELSDSFDRNEWKSVKNLKAEKEKSHTAAVNYLRIHSPKNAG